MDYNRVTNWKKRQELIKLLDLSSPPKNLYFAGKWNPLLFNRCAAIVGSRKMTSYGERVIEKLVPRLLAQNYTIVSGFMYGVDQYAHKVCVENGGLAIAVLGWGITTSLFGDDLKLAKQIIAKGGLLLSEWEEQKAALWTFPQRNRIVAALSDKTYVVEAALQSGSLITARIAAKLKRELWAVPGPITSRTSCGTNKLIADKKAKIYPYGVGSKNTTANLSNGGMGSSTYASSPGYAFTKKFAIEIRDIADVVNELSLEAIDLFKVNIEGGEYDLIPHMVKTGIINKCKIIRIQFHDWIPNAFAMRKKIVSDLSKTHDVEWSYPFVWESWIRKGTA